MVTQISNVLPWARYFVLSKVKPDNPETPEFAFSFRPDLNEKVSLWQGDITKISVDAIVNAANSSLLGGGGVDGAIHRAAGKQLRKECATLNGCEVGQAKITKGYNLPAKYIIHTVGTMTQNPVELAKCYVNSLSLMLKHSLGSIVFPCISTGIYGYDTENAAHIAIRETRMFLDKHNDQVHKIVFCVYSDEDLQIYEKLMQRYFPLNEHSDSKFSLEDIKNYVKSHPEEKTHFEKLVKPVTVKVMEFPAFKTNSKV